MDDNTWILSRVWTLWKYLIVAAGFMDYKFPEASQPSLIINQIIDEHKKL